MSPSNLRASFVGSCLVYLLCLNPVFAADAANSRRPANDQELEYWLRNMIVFHRFTTEEVTQATGLTAAEVQQAEQKFQFLQQRPPERAPDGPLRVLPYPGGRHPRIGFLDGAVNPQRETKVSVFTPWDDASYVVVDVPEAIWSNLGLTYLAHTHVPTVWSRQNIQLPQLEWERHQAGHFSLTRTLPNEIAFHVGIYPAPDGVRMEMSLTNGTSQKLTDLRVQNCVMLKGAAGFQQQTNDNKVFAKPYVACRGADSQRWVITAWQPCQRPWANPPCPCLHSDPQFPDCEPGATQTIQGWLSFYEGDDIHAEFRRLDGIAWQPVKKPSADADR